MAHTLNAHAYEKNTLRCLKKEEKEVSIANLEANASEQTKERIHQL